MPTSNAHPARSDAQLKFAFLDRGTLLWTHSKATSSKLKTMLPNSAWDRVKEVLASFITDTDVNDRFPALLLPPELAVKLAPELSRSDPETFSLITAAVKQAAGVVLRQEFVPHLVYEGEWCARWRMALSAESKTVVKELEAHVPAESVLLQTPDYRAGSLLDFMNQCVDYLVRSSIANSTDDLRDLPRDASIYARWIAALTDKTDARINADAQAADALANTLTVWLAPLRHKQLEPTTSPFRLCLRLHEPTTDDANALWRLELLIQGRYEPSLMLSITDAQRPRANDKRALERHGFHFGRDVLAHLLLAAKDFDPLAELLREPKLSSDCWLETAEVETLLTTAITKLEQADVQVLTPSAWQARPRLTRASLVPVLRDEFAGGERLIEGLNLDSLVSYDWRVALGDATLTRDELSGLAATKSELVQLRGQWTLISQKAIEKALQLLDAQQTNEPSPKNATAGEYIKLALRSRINDQPEASTTPGVSSSALAELLRQLNTQKTAEDETTIAAPDGLNAELRPYQLTGYRWLVRLARAGVGALLADDMGLGKTMQTLATIQHFHETHSADDAFSPALIVVPTTVLGNWLREAERFTPNLNARLHHGAERLTLTDINSNERPDIVITSYQTLVRDSELFQRVEWDFVVLDEAHNIKNPRTQHARVVCSLSSRMRIALTGTPVENHVGDLWSIMDFLVPGLLGSAATFRHRYLLPIQTEALLHKIKQLRELVSPFILRREKTDASIISDLPEKLESVEYCPLTVEQITLYESIVRDAAQVLRSAGHDYREVERRGLILSTIAKLKQVCNHPAHLLKEPPSSAKLEERSGKLQRLGELVEAILDQGERALIFTQYVEMAQLIQQYIFTQFACESPVLHGSLSRSERDRIVSRFQSGEAAPILILSLKAGGSGLNLTAANHVIHYDRWWNPAVENQATDRVFRIGQTRDVQVHSLVCGGTVEEQIERVLFTKQRIARDVISPQSSLSNLATLDNDAVVDLIELRERSLIRAVEGDRLEKEWRRVSL